MFEEKEQMSYDDNIITLYEEYLVTVEGYPNEAQIMSQEIEEWQIKEMIADEKGGFADEYEIK